MTELDPNTPIAVMSFDRPVYLARTLNSLVSQQVVDIKKHRVFLFQDGSYNPSSGLAKADQKDIDRCISLFKEVIHWGEVVDAPRNLGVALNFDRAEHLFFEDLGVDHAVFFEDDMIVYPYYLECLSKMIDLSQGDDRIGYVACYGNHELSFEEQEQNPLRLFLLEQNWAFSLSKRQWLKNRSYVDEYLDIIRNVDYSKRPTDAIHTLYASWGVGCPGDSQDVTKTIACCLNRSVKINISAALGRYIGERGIHMNPGHFKDKRYADTADYPFRIPGKPVMTDSDYERILRVQLGWATEHPYLGR